MKTIIILGALIVSTGAFAQTPQVLKAEQEKAKTQLKQKTESAEKSVKEYVDKKTDETTQKVIQEVPKGSELIDQAKDMIGSQDKEEMADKKISEGQAAAAKVKAESVKTEEEADEMIQASKEETQKSVQSIDTKMVAARQKLTDKLESGEYTKAQYEEKISELMNFEKRKNSIVNSMK